jgi:hypothetical protein
MALARNSGKTLVDTYWVDKDNMPIGWQLVWLEHFPAIAKDAAHRHS